MSSCAAYPICYGRNAWSRWICPWQDSSPSDGDFENYALLFGGNVDSEQWTLTGRVGLSISGTGDKTKMEILWRDENLRIRYKPSDHSQIKIRADKRGVCLGSLQGRKAAAPENPGGHETFPYGRSCSFLKLGPHGLTQSISWTGSKLLVAQEDTWQARLLKY